MTIGPGQRSFHDCEIESDLDGDLPWKLSANNILRVENCSVIEIIDGLYMSDKEYYVDCCQIQDEIQRVRMDKICLLIYSLKFISDLYQAQATQRSAKFTNLFARSNYFMHRYLRSCCGFCS